MQRRSRFEVIAGDNCKSTSTVFESPTSTFHRHELDAPHESVAVHSNSKWPMGNRPPVGIRDSNWTAASLRPWHSTCKVPSHSLVARIGSHIAFADMRPASAFSATLSGHVKTGPAPVMYRSPIQYRVCGT